MIGGSPGWTLAAAALVLTLSGCGGDVTTAEVTDQSKLSAELEKNAQDIEEKADQAVLEAEREAEAELTRMREEAISAEVASAESASTDSSIADDSQADRPAP